MNTDDFIKQSIQLAKNFCHLYMYMKTPEDVEKISLLLGEQLSVIGTGKHEISVSYTHLLLFLKPHSE